MIVSSSVSAQSFISKPDYKKIEKNIKDKKSTFYYEKLMRRFIASDSSMTLDEKQHLYYGYVFSDDYNPYSTNDGINFIYEKLNQSDSTKIDYKDVLGLQYGGEQSLIDHYDFLKLKENKFELKGLYFDITPCLQSLDKKFK